MGKQYVFIAKMEMSNSLIYRFNVFNTIISQVIICFVSIMLWKALYSNTDTVAGVNAAQMVTYSIISVLLGSMLSCSVEDKIYNSIQQGNIALNFIRPINLLLHYLAEDIGKLISSFFIAFVPLFIVVSFVYFIPLPRDGLSAVLFIVSGLLGFIIYWMIGAIFGLLSFWMTDFGNIAQVKNAVIRVLSGSIVPTWFLPKKINMIFSLFPFQYTYQTPLSFYIGKYEAANIVKPLLIQLIWVAVLFVLLYCLWKKAERNTVIQGG